MPRFLKILPTMCLLLLAVSAASQSLNVKDPTHLAAGVNRGTSDSFVGDQFWDFYVTPGKFQLSFAGSSPQEGFSVGRAPQVGMAFGPKTPGALFTQRNLPSGVVVYSGSVTQRTHVYVEVDAAKSPLVRQTVGYTLVVTGSVDFGVAGAATGPSPVGIYAVTSGWTTVSGVAKFSADGSIVTTGGAHGTWTLFDADSRVYVVIIGSDRRSLIFQPGRGFIDSVNQGLALEMRR